MKYGYTILYVKDVEATSSFYEEAFGFGRKFITPEKDYAELNTGETTIAFASEELGESNFNKGFKKWSKADQTMGVEMAFITENIEADFSRAIQAGAEAYEAIVQKPWGQKVGYLIDNNGFLIEICTPVSQ